MGGDTIVTVFHQDSSPKTEQTFKIHNSVYSFRQDWQQFMSYRHFLNSVKQEQIPGQFVLRDKRNEWRASEVDLFGEDAV